MTAKWSLNCKTLRKGKNASAILMSSLEDKPLKVVHKYFRLLSEIWAKRYVAYTSKTASGKLNLFTEAFSKTEEPESMSDHFAELETVFAQMEDAERSLNKLMQVYILLSSIKEGRNYETAFVDFRTIKEEKTNCKSVYSFIGRVRKEKKTRTRRGLLQIHRRCSSCQKKAFQRFKYAIVVNA